MGVVFICQSFVLQPLACAENNAENTDEAQQVDRIRQIVLSRGNDPVALAHLIQLSKDLQPSVAAELFGQLAGEYLRAGQLDLAAEVLRQLTDQYPDQPPAIDGLITLVQLFSSSEVAHTAQKAPQADGNKTYPVYALYLAEQALQKRRDLANNPALAFQCAVASRLSGNLRSAKNWLSPLKHNRHNQPWRSCALVETWLQNQRKGTPPKPTIRCLRTNERPLLDGALDEKMWQLAAPIQLASSDQSTLTTDSTQIKFAHDDKFFYLAIRCRKFANGTYASDKSPRSYDADLSGHDHVRLLLDLDRDYATCFQLSVDHRGQTADACWHDASWNPRWFVATAGDETFWTVEAAIPWPELTGKPPQSQEPWALAIQRQSPTGESAAWVGPPPEKNPSPESFGLLIFD